MNDAMIAAVAAAVVLLLREALGIYSKFVKDKRDVRKGDQEFIIDTYRKRLVELEADVGKYRVLIDELHTQLNFARKQVTVPNEEDLAEAKERIDVISKSLIPTSEQGPGVVK